MTCEKPIRTRRETVTHSVFTAVPYIAMLILFLCKAVYYANVGTGQPDEAAHLAYIVAMWEDPAFVPDFGSILQGAFSEYRSDGYAVLHIFENSTCNLCHPSLYYLIFSHIGGIEVLSDGTYYLVNLLYLRYANILLVGVALVIASWFARERICRVTRRLAPHWVCATAFVCVPMLAYVASGVNNDNLTILGVVLFLVGAVRYYEGNRGQASYMLVAVGFCVTMLSKITGGIVLLVAVVALLVVDMVRDHRPTLVLRREFAVTLPIYLIMIAYFAIVFVRYGTVQPSLQVINYDYFLTTGFYVAEDERVSMTFLEYVPYYFKNFWMTWVDLYGHNHHFLQAAQLESCLGSTCLVLVPFFGLLFTAKRDREQFPLFAGIFLGLVITNVIQFVNAYRSFIVNGYTGAYQARYYLAFIPFLAYATAMLLAQVEECAEMLPSTLGELLGNGAEMGGLVRRLPVRTVVLGVLACLAAAFVALLIYGDVIYLLLNLKSGYL